MWKRFVCPALLIVSSLALAVSATAADDSPLLLPGPLGAATRHHRVLPFKAVRMRHALKLGEQVTCVGGCAVQMGDGSHVALQAETVAEVSSPLYFSFPGQPMATRCGVLQLDQGTAEIVRPDFTRRPMVVRTDTALLAVHHGHALIRALAGRTVVVVRDGRVAVRRGRSWFALVAGQAHTVEGGGVRSRTIMTRPVWHHDGSHQRQLGLAVRGPKAIIEVAWEPVPGADRYQLQIAPTTRFAHVIRESRVTAPAHHLAIALPEGRYFARAWAADRDGLRSAVGRPAALRVVRASLPSGGFLPEPGVLVLPRGRALRLLDPAGLELSVDGSGFRPAPAQVPGPSHARHRLRLRIAGLPDSSTEFSLERRALRAEVSMSPTLPVWPDDAIEAEVRLVDPSGRIDPATVTPKIEIHVGSGAIAAHWTRHGARWLATIRGRAVAGPRLLQIEASDSHGIPLGWGFVEVVRDAQPASLASR